MEAECNSKESDTFDSQSSLAVRFLKEQIRKKGLRAVYDTLHWPLCKVRQGCARLGKDAQFAHENIWRMYTWLTAPICWIKACVVFLKHNLSILQMYTRLACHCFNPAPNNARMSQNSTNCECSKCLSSLNAMHESDSDFNVIIWNSIVRINATQKKLVRCVHPGEIFPRVLHSLKVVVLSGPYCSYCIIVLSGSMVRPRSPQGRANCNGPQRRGTPLCNTAFLHFDFAFLSTCSAVSLLWHMSYIN